MPKIAEQESWFGLKFDLVLDFLEKRSWDRMLSMAEWASWCWASAGRRLALGVPLLPDEPSATLDGGASGEHDEHFARLGRILVAKGQGNAILRIGWEFNGGWYRWTARKNPAAFAAAWRRAAVALRSAPGSDFLLDWNPAAADGPTEVAYPGDDVVDVIGLDTYNQAWPLPPTPEARWSRVQNGPAGLAWHRRFAEARGKPRSFPEWGTGTRPDGHGGGDDALFVRNMLDWMGEGGRVLYSAYWDFRASDYNARVSDGHLPAAGAALRHGLPALRARRD